MAPLAPFPASAVAFHDLTSIAPLPGPVSNTARAVAGHAAPDSAIPNDAQGDACARCEDRNAPHASEHAVPPALIASSSSFSSAGVQPHESERSVWNMIEGSATPLLVFINSRSGGKAGLKVATRLRALLGSKQVVDLSEAAADASKRPAAVLERFKHVEGLRVLVCGGDGTCRHARARGIGIDTKMLAHARQLDGA
eukprot:2620226-Pleurochrysis_carterae.AAC.5